MPERIVLFGGTFDPVHNGHLIVARSIAEQLGIDRVTFMPTSLPPHKPAAAASPADRLEMLRLATSGEGLFDICDMELNRPGPSYTLQTVRDLRTQRGKDMGVSLIIGADMLRELPRWHQVSKLLESADLIIATRPPLDSQMQRTFVEIAGELGSECTQQLSDAVVKVPLIEISSTEIRRRASSGLSIRYMVAEPVAGYIRDQGLYQGCPIGNCKIF